MRGGRKCRKPSAGGGDQLADRDDTMQQIERDGGIGATGYMVG
jgi:hypothetical protein